MENMKFRVNSPEHSEEIQREGIRLGLAWNEWTIPMFLDSKFLFFDLENKKFYLSNSEKDFNDYPYTETTLEQLKEM